VGNRFKNYTLYILLLIIILAIFTPPLTGVEEKDVDYSEFYREFAAGRVYEMSIDERIFEYRTVKDPKVLFKTQYALDRGDLKLFRENEIDLIDPNDPAKQMLSRIRIKLKPKSDSSWLLTLFVNALPFVFIILIWFYFLQRMQGGGTKALSFGKSRAKFLDPSKTKTTFDDVAGCDESKADLEEIIEFLKHPKKFQAIGARIPRGVLLMGPPGTGKTLLARAVAGEANVPFLHISGSDFVEMFVGVGASRVRDLFEQGKKHAPCLLFIDEIDAVGRQRGAGLGGGHDEREQTLNQLLVEMDGFDPNEGVIMIAATNRPDVLDPALLRPGRFDRQIIVDLPDVRGREGVFRVHIRKILVGEEVDLEKLAKATPGFSGADIANMVNEAALLAARRNRKRVCFNDFEEARDKIIMGPERRSRLLTDTIKVRIAFHEAGHALLPKLIPGLDAVHKVSIIPRGRALGITSFLLEEEKLYIREDHYIKDGICGLLAGRVAEELKFGDLSSGAANDIERATKMAHQMVCEFGMSEKLGPISYGESNNLVFLGRDITRDRNYSEETSREIDEEIRAIVVGCIERTRKLLKDNLDKLELLAETLLEYEVLDGAEIDKLLRGEKLDPPVRDRDEPSDCEDDEVVLSEDDEVVLSEDEVVLYEADDKVVLPPKDAVADDDVPAEKTDAAEDDDVLEDKTVADEVVCTAKQSSDGRGA